MFDGFGKIPDHKGRDVVTRNVYCKKKLFDLKSVPKNVTRIKKSSGVIELTRLTGSAQMSWESDMAT